MSQDEDIRLGTRAQQLLGDEVLSLAFANIETSQLEAWRNSPARDTEGRETIWLMMKQIDVIKAELIRMVENGKLAQVSVDQINTLRANEARAKQEIADRLGIDPNIIED